MQDLLTSLPKIQITPKVYKELPESAGVYVFFKDKEPIYIGKAINLKRRVSSYFDFDLEVKTAQMIGSAEEISFIKVNSELEALLLEARLIRKYMPKYNIAAKDDKHPLYIAITKEKYPRVLAVRKLISNSLPLISSYGPFPSSGSVRMVLKMLRRIFPYSDHKLGKRACLYSHIGLCSPCPSAISQITDYRLKIQETKKYKSNIRRIKSILDGNIGKVRSGLVKEMEEASKMQEFEKAALSRDQIQRLEYITSPQMPTEFYMQNPNLYEDVRTKETEELGRILRKFKISIEKLERIECYDVAHLAGTNATASMVTFIKGEPEKSLYRHFKIRQKKGNSDVDSLREVIERRIRHLKDWGEPDLIIVDGGRPQVSVFTSILYSNEVNIPIVGLAKRFETLVIPVKTDGIESLGEYRVPRGAALNLIERIRDEAHRFARTYHHKLVSRGFTSK